MSESTGVRHFASLACLLAYLLASTGLSHSTLRDRSHRHSPGASLCRQTDTNHTSSAIVSQHHRRPLYTRVSPFLESPRPREGHSFCYTRPQDTTPRPNSFALSPQTKSLCKLAEFRWGLRITKPTQASYIQPHDFTVPQRPTGPVLHNGRKVRLTGFDTVPADLVIPLGLILESRRNAHLASTPNSSTSASYPRPVARHLPLSKGYYTKEACLFSICNVNLTTENWT